MNLWREVDVGVVVDKFAKKNIIWNSQKNNKMLC